MEHPWLFSRIREVQGEPDGRLDLWARGHYKSTIITYAKTLQDILASHGNDPLSQWEGREICCCIFSHTRPIAKSFLRQIKRELEMNNELKMLFPDVLWLEPAKEAPKWSEDDGLILRRGSNPKESTLEAWGLVDGQPISRHYDLMVYDDVVTKGSVFTPEMIAKTTEAWELSLNLTSNVSVKRYIGTRYHFNDTYRVIMDRKAAKPRLYPATDDGRFTGNPVFFSKQQLEDKINEMGPWTAASQLMQNPKADEAQGFKREWLRYYKRGDGQGMNRYILVDPASGKKKDNDYTVFAVIGLGLDRNYYLLDMVRDRLNLEQRTNTLFQLHQKWRPLGVGYEEYGLQADIEHIRLEQERINYRFGVTPLKGRLKKEDRIRRLVPPFAQGHFYLPACLWRTDYQGKQFDLIEVFQNEEYDPFPVGVHDDMLDAMSRVMDEDMSMVWPESPVTRYETTKHSKPPSWVVR